MQKKIIKQSLICTLTEKERREYGIQLATTLGDIDEIEAEKKRTMDHFKDRIAGLQAQADDLSRKVRDGKEWRKVECYVLLGAPDKTHKQIVRMDTGETVKTEVMDEHDLQSYMPFAQPVDANEEEPDPSNPSDPSATQDGPDIIDAEDQDDDKHTVNGMTLAIQDAAQTIKTTKSWKKQKETVEWVEKEWGLLGLSALFDMIPDNLTCGECYTQIERAISRLAPDITEENPSEDY